MREQAPGLALPTDGSPGRPSLIRIFVTQHRARLAARGDVAWLAEPGGSLALTEARFTASLHTLISGLQAAQPGHRHPRH